MRLIDADALPEGRVEWEDIVEAPEVDAVPVELIQKRIDALNEVADAEFELNGGYVGSAFSLVCSLERLLREWAERKDNG